MKRFIGTFVIILIAVGFADLLQGFLLTWLYVPDNYTNHQLELPGLVRYGMTAFVVMIALYGARKITASFRKPLPSQ